jgi:hypothetical protein
VSPLLLVAIALITYGTRAAALVFMPRPSARIEAMLGRMPAPIFAGLATATLLTGDGSVIGGPILWAAVGALLASPARSLLFCLLGGAAGYALGALLR